MNKLKAIIISGNPPKESICSSYPVLEHSLLTTGGLTGRGVTPCPIGHHHNKNIDFEPSRPGYLPPQGDLRALMRIGNEWRN